MTGNGLGLILFLAFASCTGTAAAQQSPEADTKPTLGSILRDILPSPYRGDDPVWKGVGMFAPLPGAVTRMSAGERKVGDVVAEIDVALVRGGRITSAVEIDHPVHGKLSLAMETPVISSEASVAGGGGGQPLRTISRSLEWCTVVSPGGLPVCMARRADDTVLYEEFKATPEGQRLSQTTGRTWKGAVPVIVEVPMKVITPVVRRLSIGAVTNEGVTFRFDSKTGDRVVDGGATGVVPWGTTLTNNDRFPGLAFIVRRGKTPEQVQIVLVTGYRQ
jgi:hypothetical protein